MSTGAPKALTTDSGNYFFGFHDTIPWNREGTKFLVLKIDDITTPPDPEVPCEFGWIEKGQFKRLGYTYAYNYPQGARQQWVGKTNHLIINDKIDSQWRAKLYDADNQCLLGRLEFPAHVVTDDGWAFGIDYARLHRVGGYGYTGLPDRTAKEHAPGDSGIQKHHIYTKEATLILSIKQVANFQMKESAGKHHYITHLLLNPAQTRIAFLHRYKLKDGGETTRLMTIGINGADLRCVVTGFLSHFDWKDDTHIAIWGRTGSGIEKFRQSLLYKLLPSDLVSSAKKIIKRVLLKNNRGNKDNPAGAAKSISASHWMLLSDENNPVNTPLAKGIINEDGHPMFCPANRDWLICDTYPDSNGDRVLFLFQYSTQTKIDLGTYRMIDSKPDITKVGQVLQGVEKSVLDAFSIENMAFYRSGFHCDLHPRWKADGATVAFDSIHEGRRLVYSYDVSQYIW